MVNCRDYGYSINPATNLAKISLIKGNIAEAKHYIDLAQDCYKKEKRVGTVSRIYEVLSKYYAATGNVRLSMAYMDSTITENKQEEERFSAVQMLRVEQRQNLSEQKLKEEQLNAEKIRSSGYKRSLIITFSALLVIGAILARYFVLYRKKQAAYHELVRKSQEWAHVETGVMSDELRITNYELEEETGKQHLVPDEVDFLLMKDIEKLMLEDKLYRNTELSVDLVARKLGVKKHYVPLAISSCMNKSFNTFVNEYRIKEAILLLSNNDTQKFTIDSIAFDVGFTDRYNFYRVFKKMTGLSPTEFRRNIAL
jgi:AraC-like DNA-binding protein